MSLSIIPLVILGQITEASVNDDASLYQMTFKDINGVPLYGVTAVWTDEQAEIEALAAQKPYGVWINPIDGTFTVKFAGYTYAGSADLTDPNVLAGITPIEFNNEAGGGGSGDLKLCKVTITNNTLQPLAISVPFAVDNEEFNGSMGEAPLGPSGSPRSSFDANIIAYKGQAQLSIPFDSDTSMASLLVETTGSVEYNATKGIIIVTGDGTVTFSSQ